MSKHTTDADHIFQSTPSVWRETIQGAGKVTGNGFQSTPSVWRETWCLSSCRRRAALISIHSLRVEGDSGHFTSWTSSLYFNPLPPCGGRQGRRMLSGFYQSFQSTPSVWRETQHNGMTNSHFQFQSTPSVWRETLLIAASGKCLVISIHSLRVEGDITGIPS